MSTSPIRQVPLEKKVADLLRRIGELERKAKTAGATTLDGLRDTEVLYDHWTDLPKLGQALRWDTARESKYHGLATFADPTVVADYFTVSITGAGTFELDGPETGVGEFLVDTDWDVDRPCLVTATVGFKGGYASQEITPFTVPPTYHQPPTVRASLVDGDSGAVSTPGTYFEYAAENWEIEFAAWNFDSQLRTLSWLYTRGRPKIIASVIVSADAAPGLAGSPELVALTRCTRL